jgi:hypothetical protein
MSLLHHIYYLIANEAQLAKIFLGFYNQKEIAQNLLG